MLLFNYIGRLFFTARQCPADSPPNATSSEIDSQPVEEMSLHVEIQRLDTNVVCAKDRTAEVKTSMAIVILSK